MNPNLDAFRGESFRVDTSRADLRRDCLEVLSNQAERLSLLKKDTLVVTGGTGFVGTWIAELIACLNDEFSFGTKLILLSRHSDHFYSTRPHLANRPDIRLLTSDVRYMIELPKETNWLIHAAGNPDNRFHSSHPLEIMSTIAEGTSAVLRAVHRCPEFKMFLNMSSGLVYGSQPFDLEKIPESYIGAPDSNSVSSAYASAKRYSETFVAAARSEAQIPSINVRPFAFIGPYQSLETPWAINNFIHDALRGKPIRVFGDGKTIRSYMYGSDMAYWLLRMVTSGKSGACFNLGSSVGISLEQLASRVASHFNPRPEVHLSTMNSPKPPLTSRFVPSVEQVSRFLELDLRVDLETAIERTIKWGRRL